MNRIATVIGSLVVIGASLPASANPVSYGQQLCVMLKSGISQEKAWSCIANEHSKAAMANSQNVIPLYSEAKRLSQSVTYCSDQR